MVLHPAALALAGYRLALATSGYRRLWLAAIASRAGDTIQFVALPLFVYALTRSPAAVGATVLSEGIGLLAGGALAQLVVDRLRPRPLMVGLDLARAGAALLLTAVATFPAAVVVSFLLALATGCFSPASASLVPRLVPDRALPAANGLQWTAGVLLQLALAPIAGLLFVAAGARAAFALNAASFLVSALLLAGLPNLTVAAKSARAAGAQLHEALRVAGEVAVLRPLLAVQALAALAVGATSALLVVLAQGSYRLDGTGYGLWLGAIGAGALVGPLLVPMVSRFRMHQVIGVAYVIRGAGDIGLSALSHGALGALLLGVYGANTSSGMVAFQTFVQREVPETMRGRAFALLDVAWQSGRLVSIMLGSALASSIGIRAVFGIGGALLIVAGVVGLLGLGSAPRLAPSAEPSGRRGV
jgi:MFS family permease